MLFVLDAVLKATLILACTAAGAVLLRRGSAAARHFIWTLGVIGALAAPVLTLALPRWEVPIVTLAASESAAATEGTGRDHNGGTSVPPFLRVKPLPLPPSSPVVREATASTTHLSPIALALLVWAIGAALILGRMLLGLGAVEWISRRTQTVSDAPWLAQAEALARSLGLRRVRFLQSRVASMPMAWGVCRASVLVPSDADAWPSERLRIVLLHELAHVKRRDCLTHLLAQVAWAVYWFNPLAWLAVTRLRAERERACDDLVLAAGTRGSDYADQLLDIARVMNATRFPTVLGGASLAMAHRSQLEGRLMAILDPSIPRRGITRARAAGATTLFALLILPIASVRPWAQAPSSPLTSDYAVPAVALAPRAQPAPAPAPQPRPDAQADTRGGTAADRKTGTHVEASLEDSVGMLVQSVVEGTLQGVAGGISQGIAGGIRQGVAGGIGQGVGRGVGQGVGRGAGQGVGRGVSDAIGDAVSTAIAESVADAMQEASAGEKSTAPRRPVDPRTMAALQEALKDTDKTVRETALVALVQTRDAHIVELLVAALRDADADIRQQAAVGLGQMHDRRAVEPLISALKDERGDVREQAAFALGQLHDARAVEALTIALKDADPDVRAQCAFALGQLRDPRAIDALTAALKDACVSVRQMAAFALGQIR